MQDETSMTREQVKLLQDRYHAACHAMQTGVAYDQQYNPKDKEPKHLRVGINVALCDHTALVRLLIDKGLITELEYWQAVTAEMDREVERYTAKINERFGSDKIKLA